MTTQDESGREGSREVVLGTLSVIARLGFGSENLKLVLTDSRLLVAHLGKRGVGALAVTSFLGKLAIGFEDLFKSGGESRRKRRMEMLEPGQILEADKDNFHITYDDIVRVEVRGSDSGTHITLLTKSEKLEFFTPRSQEETVEFLGNALPGKVTVQGLGL